MVAGVFPRGSIEDVLSRPGNEALTAGDVIAANGTSLTPEQVAAAMSGEGLVIESDVLTPNTEYEFGVCATNEESVGVSVVKDFATVSLPQYDGNLLCHYCHGCERGDRKGLPRYEPPGRIGFCSVRCGVCGS